MHNSCERRTGHRRAAGAALIPLREGKPTGKPQADGTFPEGTVYGMAMAKLQELIPEEARRGDAAGAR